MDAVILGTGRMARIHAARLARLPDVRVSAVVSRGGAALPGAQGVPVFPGVEALRASGLRPELALICLPSHLHQGAAEALSAFVPHLICEKPAALSLEDAQAMERAARDRGCTLQIAQVARAWDSGAALARHLRAGRDALHTLTLRRRQPRPDWSSGGWFADPARSGGVLYDLAIHDIDYVTWLFGPPRSVSASHGPGGGSATLFLDYPGFCAVVCASWTLPASYAGGGMELYAEAAFTDKLVRFDGVNAPGRLLVWDGGGAEEEPFPSWDPYARQLEQMLAAIRSGGALPFSIESVLPALSVCAAAGPRPAAP